MGLMKTPAESLYEEVNINGRIKFVDEMIVFVKTTTGSYMLMESSNASSKTMGEAIKMLKTSRGYRDEESSHSSSEDSGH